ncbi:MAG: redoxin domain-containing protein, partial [Clostridia bacterium]|nr:redoxin domain-containing protein [Clostridia bacterium]
SCPGAVGACPLGAIQNTLAASGHRAGWYVLGILLLYGVILGRTVCGWICPLGLIQELLHRIPTPKIRKSAVTRALTWLKYIVLGLFVLALPLWYGLARDEPLPAFCKYICPAGTLEGAIGLLPANPGFFGMLGVFFTRKFVILLVIGLACVFCYRSFCRFLCPLGALYGLFSRFNIIGVKVDADRCSHCGACVTHCEMDVRRVGDHECIQCGRCMDSCSRGAISLKAGKITLRATETGCAGEPQDAPKKRRSRARILWAAALTLLCFAVLWYNVLDPALQPKEIPAAVAVTEAPAETAPAAVAVTEVPAETAPAVVTTEAPAESAPAAVAVTEAPAESAPAVDFQSEAPIGCEVGQQLEDFTAECLDGSVFHLADYRGKVVLINLWATWCTPCIRELPWFDDLYREHEDDIAVLAIHSPFVTEDPAQYLAGKGFSISFAVDSADERLFKIVRGSASLPQTVVLNRKGEVVYNQVRSVTPEQLNALYEEASR